MMHLKATTLFLSVAAIAQTAFAGSDDAVTMRRERRFALRQVFERAETYPGGEVPACIANYDNTLANGDCSCGEGRVQAGPTDCELAPGTDDFDSVHVGPFTVTFDITVSGDVTAPSTILNTAQCASICSLDSECIAFYLGPSAAIAGDNSCWKIGLTGSYGNPSNSGIPFTPSGSANTKRAVGQTGTVGNALGQAAVPTANCDPEAGDVANANLTCTCGPNRVNTTPNVCVAAATPSGSLGRRGRRSDAYAVQW